MFTNEQIREAMTGLVQKKGEDHSSFGRYADPVTGRGACFLGALVEHMGFAVPAEGTSARQVLGHNAVSKEMGFAFAVAQTLNDSNFEWKYVLYGVDLALASDQHAGIQCPCGCGSSSESSRILDEVKKRRALDKMSVPQYPFVTGLSNGGIISGMNITGISTSMSGLSLNITASASAFAGLEAILAQANAKVATQKDHALVA